MLPASPVVRFSTLALATFVLLLASGCVMHFDGWESSSADLWGNSVSSKDGVMYVDDVRVPFDRWVDVTADLAGISQLELGTGTDAISVTGVPGPVAALRVRIYSEVEGDGEARFEENRLAARSPTGHKVFINAIEGTLPESLALSVTSGTGAITLVSFAGDGDLTLSSGTSAVTLRSCQAGSVKVESGTGNVLLEDCSAPKIRLDCGTGVVKFLRCRGDQVSIETGTGDAMFTGCDLGSLEFDSGTGDLVLDGGQVERVESDTRAGGLSQRGGVKVGSLEDS